MNYRVLAMFLAYCALATCYIFALGKYDEISKKYDRESENSAQLREALIATGHYLSGDVVVDGFAGRDQFWVYTKNKTITEVLQICAHEYAHTNLDLADKRQ